MTVPRIPKFPGEQCINKELVVKKIGDEVDLKVVDIERRRYDEDFPKLVGSNGACGEHMGDFEDPVADYVDIGPNDLGPTTATTPTPVPRLCGIAPVAVSPYPVSPGSTSLDTPDIIATLTEGADCGCRGGTARTACSLRGTPASVASSASGSLVGTMLAPDAAKAVKPELYMSEMMRTIQEDMRIMRQVIEADERLDGLYTEDEDGELIASLTRVVKCAMDSGACASVIHPDMLPSGVVPATRAVRSSIAPTTRPSGDSGTPSRA